MNTTNRNSWDSIESVLGQPRHSGEGFLIYQGDCLEYLKRLPRNVLPLTVTSPPYNIGKEYEAIQDVECYLEWCESWIKEIYRSTRITVPFG